MTKEARIYNGEDGLFSKPYWESWTAACKSVKLEHTLTPYTKISSKWLKELNIKTPRREQAKHSLSTTNVSLHQSSKTTEIKTKINKWDLTKLIRFCTAKETIKKRKR